MKESKHEKLLKDTSQFYWVLICKPQTKVKSITKPCLHSCSGLISFTLCSVYYGIGKKDVAE